MKTYRITGCATVSIWTDVEASSPEEALEIAAERELGGLCHGAIYGDIAEVFHFENDGMPQELRVEDGA